MLQENLLASGGTIVVVAQWQTVMTFEEWQEREVL